MKNSLKNIINLSMFFIIDTLDNGINLKKIVNVEVEKNNKKGHKSFSKNKKGFLWIIILLFFSLAYLSSKIIIGLKETGKPEIFLSGYSLILIIFITIQAIMLTTNIFYFSKDLEIILPMPFKSTEILLAKFNTLLYFLYTTIILFGIVPFTTYGVYLHLGIWYYVKLIIALINFPIFSSVIVTTLTMLLIKLFKFIKGKELLQNVVSISLLLFMFLGLYGIGLYSWNNYNNAENISQTENLINELNKCFLNIDSILKMIQGDGYDTIINMLFLIISDGVLIFILYFIGKRTYLKQILNLNYYFKKIKRKKIQIINRCKVKRKSICYIINEFKKIFTNTIFFTQCIYPIVLITFSCVIMISIFIQFFQKIGENSNYLDGLSFNIEAVTLILGGIQMLGLLNKMSVTSISRDGKSALYMKALPIDLYDQFVYRNVPQIIVNTIMSVIILVEFYGKINVIELKYIIIMLISSILLFAINSYIVLIINLIIPKLDWSSEYEIFKNNKGIIMQYLLIILNIIMLYYFNEVFYDVDLNIALSIFISVLGLVFILLNILVEKFKAKLFEKIN